MGAFGFSTDSSAGGDFLPIIKYDARAGRMFRIDRVNTGAGFDSTPVDITLQFRALADFENLETGWIDFQAGSAPSFVMVRLDDLDAKRVMFPVKPGPTHKSGVRFMVKLMKDIAGDSQVREIAGTARTFLTGVEQVYTQYKAERLQHAGQLPVLAMDGMPIPIKTGVGERSSTNYQPKFKIIGWASRGDLKPMPRGASVAPSANGHDAPPNTGAGARPAPGQSPQQAPLQQPAYQQPKSAEFDPSDFG